MDIFEQYAKKAKGFKPILKKQTPTSKTTTLRHSNNTQLYTFKHVMADVTHFSQESTRTHLILEMGRSEIMECPLFHEPAEKAKATYLIDKDLLSEEEHRDVEPPPDNSFIVDLYGNDDNFMAREQYINQYASAMSDENVMAILQWISVVRSYLHHKKMTPEVFQLEMFAHAVFFIASITAYQQSEIYEILKRCFNVEDEQYYKAKSCVFMVMRRQGKTEWTKIMFAAALLTLPNIRLAYYVHHVNLLDVALSDIELQMKEMYHIHPSLQKSVKTISYCKGASKLVVTFRLERPAVSTLEGRSTSNPDVSNIIKINLI